MVPVEFVESQFNAIDHLPHTAHRGGLADTRPHLNKRRHRFDIELHCETDGRNTCLVCRKRRAVSSHVSHMPFSMTTNGSMPPRQSIRCRICSFEAWYTLSCLRLVSRNVRRSGGVVQNSKNINRIKSSLKYDSDILPVVERMVLEKDKKKQTLS
jgi:hypothetical protein